MIRWAYKRVFCSPKGLDPDEALSNWDILSIFCRVGQNSFRGLFLRARMKKCDGTLFVAKGVKCFNPRKIECGRNVKFEELCEIQGLSRQGLFFGDNVTIGRGTSIRPSSYYGGELGEGIRIGKNSSIGAFSWIGASGFVDIGQNVLFGPRVVLIPENHRSDNLEEPIREQGVERESITIEDNCWIGTGATILSGVTIGTGSIVAAGAVVVKNVEANSIVGGVPAHLIRKRECKKGTEKRP